jgi:hypothetical protein
MGKAKQDDELTPTVWQVLGSTMMSYLGVSTPERRQRDFEQGDAKVFVVMGFIVALFFIALVMTVVKLVLSN